MMANQCRTAIRRERPLDGLVSGTFEDMKCTVVAAAQLHCQFFGPGRRADRRDLELRGDPVGATYSLDSSADAITAGALTGP